MNYLRFCLVAEVTACILMAVQPTYASDVSAQDTSSSSSTTLSTLQTKQDDPMRSESSNSHQLLARALKLDENNQSLVNGTPDLIQGKIPVGNLVDNIDSHNLEQKQSIGLSNPSGIKKQSERLGNVQEVTQLPNLPSDIPVLPSAPSSPNGVMVPNPEIIIRSNGTANPDILNPTVPVAPVLPRAVAPPVGDMSISNINTRFDPVDLGSAGKAMIPRLVLRRAPADEVLKVLARYIGINIVIPDNLGLSSTGSAEATSQGGGSNFPTISLDIENETVQDVFNSVLIATGLKSSRQGNMIYVAKRLPDEARNIITRTIRLNQVSAENATAFLAIQGAQSNVLIPGDERPVRDPDTGRSYITRTAPQIQPLQVNEAVKPLGVTPLKGLFVASDSRLNSITLTGEPRLVEVATTLLTQLDARRRQVAVNVKIVDINLTNIQDYNSSFSFGSGDSYFVQDNGAAVMRFGSTAPVSRNVLNSATGLISNPPIVTNPLNTANVFLDTNNPTTIQGITTGATIDSVIFPSVAGVSTNPLVTGLTDFTPAQSVISNGVQTITSASATYGLPTFFQYPRQFQAQIFTQIQSGNAKILTDPTLVIQEGQEASVKLTQSVVSSVNTQVDPLSGVRTTTPVLSDVGLTLQVNIDRIDDNGFISLSVKPIVASPGAQQQFESGTGANNTLTLINKRELTSGLLRLRDGQTLILAGIISEQDQSVASKVPILGDLPVIGALFRSQTDTTNRSEVVVMLTPQIIHDNTESQFGYNYTPGKATADYLRQQGFPVQVQP